MTNPKYRHLLVISDRSGSMDHLAEDMSGGINQLIQDQTRADARTTVSLRQFDTEHDEVFSFVEAGSAPEYTLVPRGGTALLDAVGTGIVRLGEELAAMPEDERPGEVTVLIVTDGHENSSREYTRQMVRDLIERQTSEYGWKFTYLGANQDSFAEAGAIGIHSEATMDWAEVPVAMASASDAMLRSYSAGTKGVSYTAAERSASMGKTGK